MQSCFSLRTDLQLFLEPKFKNLPLRIIWPSNGRVKEPAITQGLITSKWRQWLEGSGSVRYNKKSNGFSNSSWNEGRLATISICNLARLLAGRRRDFWEGMVWVAEFLCFLGKICESPGKLTYQRKNKRLKMWCISGVVGVSKIPSHRERWTELIPQVLKQTLS